MAEAARRRPARDDRDEPPEDSPRRRASSASRYAEDDDRDRERGRDRDDDRPRRDRDDRDDESPREQRRRNREAFDEGASEGRGESRRATRDDDDDDRDRDRDRPRSRDRDRDDDRDRDRDRDRDDDRSSRRSRDDDDAPRGGRRGRDDDDRDAPELGGWEAARAAMANAGRFTDRYKPTEETTLIKLMEDIPFASVNVHWVPNGRGKNKPVFCTLVKYGECPLCDAGVEINVTCNFNVVVMNGKKPKVIVWEANKLQTDALMKKGESRSGPLSRPYWAVQYYQQGGNGPWKIDIEKVTEAEVEDDWRMDVLSKDELRELDKQCHDESYVKFPTRQEMRDLAKALDDA